MSDHVTEDMILDYYTCPDLETIYLHVLLEEVCRSLKMILEGSSLPTLTCGGFSFHPVQRCFLGFKILS